jgi:hypothetical protein
MPSARLITDSIEEAQDLAADLRNRGFVVEVVSNNHIPLHRVDLEVRLEESPTEEALRRAEELSKTEDMHVYIAPGAIVESLRPMISVPLELTSTESGMPAPAEPEQFFAPFETGIEPGEIAFAADQHQISEVASEPLTEVEEAFASPEFCADETAEVFSPSAEIQSLQVFAQEEQVIAEIPQSEDTFLQEEIPAVHDESPVSADLEAPVERLPVYALETQESPILESPRDIFAEEVQVTAKIPSSDSPALGEEIFAQENEQPLSALETTVDLSPTYAMEGNEAFPPSDWPIWQPLVEEEPELATVSAPAVAMAPRSIRSVGTFTRTRNNDRLFWRLAIVASVIAVSTMLLGVSAHRFSPIPRGLAADDGGLPFKSKTASANAQSVADALPQVAPAAPATEFKRVLVHMPLVDRPSAAERIGGRAERAKRYQRAATRREDEVVAKDTVVRFRKKPEAPRIEAQKKSGIRHYSDLR